MRRRAIVLATLMVVATGLALVLVRSVPSTGEFGSVVGAPRVTWATSARPHPHGPEADEVTRVPAGHSWSARIMWSGAGRHPMWRGCQHRYDPALASFIFGSASPTG
jgi:hypothetical protein